MNADTINKAFAHHIYKSGAWKQMKITRHHQCLLRNHLKRGINISLEKKMRLLQLCGWRQDAHEYTRADMVALAKDILKASAAARAHGAEYLVDKYLHQRAVV